MTPTALNNIPAISHGHSDPLCNVGFQLAWSTAVGSAVFASPVIFPSGLDGQRQIFLSTFFQTVEALGHDGYKLPGWPLQFEDSTFQGSPLLYDVDGDGKNDVGMVDKNGNLFWVRMGEFGQYLEDYHIQVPKLKIKRDWHKGLKDGYSDSYIMNSMFDHDGMGYYKRWNEPKTKLFENKEEKKEAYTSGKVKPDVLAAVSSKFVTKGRLAKNAAVTGSSVGPEVPTPNTETMIPPLSTGKENESEGGKVAPDDDPIAREKRIMAQMESPPLHGRRLRAIEDVEEQQEHQQQKEHQQEEPFQREYHDIHEHRIDDENKAHVNGHAEERRTPAADKHHQEHHEESPSIHDKVIHFTPVTLPLSTLTNFSKTSSNNDDNKATTTERRRCILGGGE